MNVAYYHKTDSFVHIFVGYRNYSYNWDNLDGVLKPIKASLPEKRSCYNEFMSAFEDND